jgi:hypothetical protein
MNVQNKVECLSLAGLFSIRLDWKSSLGTNTVAYYVQS